MRLPAWLAAVPAFALVAAGPTEDPPLEVELAASSVCSVEEELVYVPTGEYNAARSAACTA